MFKFLTTRPLWVNILAAIVLSAALIFGALQLLGSLTRHGEFLKVPAVLKKSTPEAVRQLKELGFEVLITDSVYVDSMPRGIVLKQIPDGNSLVKVNRTVILVVNRVTLPMVDVPALQGKSLSYALELLRRSHLTLGDTSFRPDFQMGAVLEQNYHGAPVEPGAKLQYGSVIDLVIGGGLSNQLIAVPNLVGMTYGEAKAILDADFIGRGALIPESPITDTATAFVTWQRPPRLNEDDNTMLNYIQSGQIIDLWINQTSTISPMDSLKPEKPKPAKKPKEDE